jgi:hypothetical protein
LNPNEIALALTAAHEVADRHQHDLRTPPRRQYRPGHGRVVHS